MRTCLLLTLVTVLAAGCADAPSPRTGTGDQQVQAAAPQEAERRTTLVIGSVSDDPAEEIEVFDPFIDAVAADLRGEGVTGGEVVVTGTVEEMAAKLRAGEVDLYVDSMYGASTAVRDGAAVPLLRRWKDGAAQYRSVVFVRADSPLRTPDDLTGETVSFTEDTSTDGWFLPAATLAQQGVRLAPLVRPGDPVPAGRTGYVFSGDDENSVFHVLSGRTAAGVSSEEDLAENAGSRAGELRTLATSIPVPRHGVVASTSLEPELSAAVRDHLTALHTTADGPAVLAAFDETARFDALTPADLQPVLRMADVLDDAVR